MRYRVGWPLWKLACKLGFRLYFRAAVSRCSDCADYCGYSPDIEGLFAEAADPKEVIEAMVYGAKEFIQMDLHGLEASAKRGTSGSLEKVDCVLIGSV